MSFSQKRPTFRVLHILGGGGGQERDGHSKDDGHGYREKTLVTSCRRGGAAHTERAAGGGACAHRSHSCPTGTLVTDKR